tara:strand:- start:1389 stop:1535 length:147 start_codon:yes stop_codon:yes gene_type:complete
MFAGCPSGVLKPQAKNTASARNLGLSFDYFLGSGFGFRPKVASQLSRN